MRMPEVEPGSQKGACMMPLHYMRLLLTCSAAERRPSLCAPRAYSNISAHARATREGPIDTWAISLLFVVEPWLPHAHFEKKVVAHCAWSAPEF